MLGWGSTAGSGRAIGGRDELGLLLSTLVWPILTGLLGWGRFWRKLRSRYSDKSILRPRLGRGGSHVVWCLYIARSFSPKCFHLGYNNSGLMLGHHLVFIGKYYEDLQVKRFTKSFTNWSPENDYFDVGGAQTRI